MLRSTASPLCYYFSLVERCCFFPDVNVDVYGFARHHSEGIVMSLSSGNLSSRSGVLGIVRDRTHELRDWGANEDSPQHNHQQSQQQQQLQMQLQIEPEDDVTTLPEDSVSYIASWVSNNNYFLTFCSSFLPSVSISW